MLLQLPLRGVDDKFAVIPRNSRGTYAEEGCQGRLFYLQACRRYGGQQTVAPQGPAKGIAEVDSAAEAALMSSGIGSGESIS